jgi:hypothetical protein
MKSVNQPHPIPHSFVCSDPLFLIEQTSLVEDMVVYNGQNIKAHVVVKNSPFAVTFQAKNGLDLNQYSFEIRLVYDFNREKEVDFIKAKPFAFKMSITPSGTRLVVEARIKVLTSQLEDSCFRISVTMTESATGRSVPTNQTHTKERAIAH